MRLFARVNGPLGHANMPHRLVPPALSITLGPIRNVRATKHDLASRNVAAAVLAEQRSRPVKGDNPPLFTDSDVDTFAWAFLRSTYAGPIYADWSLDLRLDTFSRRQGFSHVADSGDLSISSWIASWPTGAFCLATGKTWRTDRRRAPTRFTNPAVPTIAPTREDPAPGLTALLTLAPPGG